MVDGYLNFDTRIDTKGFEKGLGNVQNGLKSIKSILGQLSTAALAAFSVKAVVDFGKKAVESAQKFGRQTRKWSRPSVICTARLTLQ